MLCNAGYYEDERTTVDMFSIYS